MSISFISAILGPLTGTSPRVIPVPRHSAYEVMADFDAAQSRKRLAFCGFLAPLTRPLASNVHGTPSDGQITSMGAPCFLATSTSYARATPMGVSPDAAIRPGAPPDLVTCDKFLSSAS